MGKDKDTRKLFKDGTLFDDSYEAELEEEKNKPVECLGITFPNDEERWKYFIDRLKEKLKDPEFRKIDGFPIGKDEDILSLSDPPYYTACPNPFIEDFIKIHSKSYEPNIPYDREPFATDVSEGKYDPLYKIHSYPTKIPFRAIMRYILHFTRPGDIVFDGFCGTGMTGVAALMCGSKYEFGQLEDKEANYIKGVRNTILCDLSTNATHIASNYTRYIDQASFLHNFNMFLEKCETACDWVYKTVDPINNKLCNINYTVWSEVFVCEHCLKEYSYWDSSVKYQPGDKVGIVSLIQRCPHCSAEATRRTLTNSIETIFDPILQKTIKSKKHVAVLLNCVSGKRRFEKYPGKFDFELMTKVKQELSIIAPSVHIASMMLKNSEIWGDLQREYHFGITHAHHFFSARNLFVLSIMSKELNNIAIKYRDTIRFLITACFNRVTNFVRYMPQYKERNVGPLSGTLYIPMLFGELNIFNVLKAKVNRALDGLSHLPSSKACIITTQSSGMIGSQLNDNVIDYIFTDPPFGDNLPYSELNFNEETWLGVHTNNQSEAIISEIQKKDLHVYKELITRAFKESYRILKPGRWMTIVFHNSQNRVWNVIQESLFEAGFVVADVRTLDKQRGTTKQQVYTSGAVKQDLVISCYKPNGGLEERFQKEGGTEEGVWDFVLSHLKQLPVFVSKDGQAEVIAERQNFLLFDRMVAFHVQRGERVPLSASAFYKGLTQRYSERDGMYFIPEQVVEYDSKRMAVKEMLQLQLFVTDEPSAIQWLKQQLAMKPLTFQEIHPQFLREIGGWNKQEKPLELFELLEQNFLCYDGKEDVPSQIHSYLSTNCKELQNIPRDAPLLKTRAKDRWYIPDHNKASDLERLRERALMREFEEYKKYQKKFRNTDKFRLEAIRAGFSKAWHDRDYATIISVAKKIPENILQEDPKLLMWYDLALTRTE